MKTEGIRGKKILVVDDDPSILEAITFMLDSEGYEVVTDTGEGVNDCLKKYSPQLVLLDIMLGSKDGREIAQALKTDKETKKLPIIFISASSTMNAEVAKSYGVDDFIPKPFEIDDLLKKVAHYVKVS